MIQSKTYILIAGLAGSTLLSACATNSGAHYQPIVDGPKTAQYHTDVAECQEIARQRKYVNGDTKNDAILGAVAGALFGALDDDADDDVLPSAIGGAIVGGLLAGGSRAYETRDERKYIVQDCVAGRGHRVVG